MKDYFIQFGVPVLTAIIAYLSAIYQSKNQVMSVQEQCRTEIEKAKEQSRTEIEKIKEQSKSDIARIQIELDKQAEVYEKNAQVDLTREFMADFMRTPQGKQLVNNQLKQHLKRK